MKIIKLAVIIALALALILAAVCLHYKLILEKIFSQALAARVEIGAIRLQIRKHTLQIHDLRIYNPEDFSPNKLLIDVPRITAVFDFKNLIIKRKLHFNSLDIYVKLLVVIKDRHGKFNVEQLAIFKENFQEIPLQTDRLILTADHVIFKDETRGPRPHTEYFAVKIKDQVYQGLPSFEDITAKVFSEMIKRTTINGAKMLGNAVVMNAVGGWSLLLAGETYNVVSGKSNYEVTFDVDYAEAYQAALEVAGEMGKDIRQRENEGIIQGYIDDADVVIKITRQEAGKTAISVSAKKYFFPKLNISGGVLYEIAERLGKV